MGYTSKNIISKGCGLVSLSACLISSVLTVGALLLFGATPAYAQGSAVNAGPGDIPGLYRQLQTVGLDPSQVFDVRDAAIDREDVHLSLDAGTIAFTRSVGGQITGALFVGDGEVLVVPPNSMERHSLAMFTGAAILDERFTSAYFRFFDNKLLAQLRPALRPAEDGATFIDAHNSTAKALASVDALRLLVSMTRTPAAQEPSRSQFIRAQISGEHLGNFDLSWDTARNEEIAVGQASFTSHGAFYDQWMLFPMRSTRQRERELHEAGKSSDELYVDSALISDFKINTEIRPPTALNVNASLRLDIRVPGDRVLLFELSRYLKISSLTMHKDLGPITPLVFIQNEALQGSELARRGNDLVAVVFPQPLQRGEKFQLNFSYAGDVLSEAGGGLLYVGARGTWFPNRGPWMSNFDLTFTYPSGWKLLATGKPVADTIKNGMEESRWISERPIPLAGFNLGKYLNFKTAASSGKVAIEADASEYVENASPDKVVLLPPVIPQKRNRAEPDWDTSPSLPPDPAANLKMVAERSRNTIDFLEPRMGPFPYTNLYLTQMPGPNSQGWPGLVYLSSRVFLTPEQRHSRGERSPMEIIYDRLMEAHETSHQWWGDAVFWRSYRDQWLMEALANYSALLELEKEKPKDAAAMLEYYRKALQSPAPGNSAPLKDAGPVGLGLRLDSSKFSRGYETVAYGRGTWLIHMLRNMFRDAETLSEQNANEIRKHGKIARSISGGAANKGDRDALFFSVLRGLQEKFAGKVMSTPDLQLALENVLPKSLQYEDKPSLDWFFEGWVGGTDIPKIDIEKLHIARSGGRSIARFMLRQKDAPDSLVTSVPIYAESAKGKLTLAAQVFADGNETDLKITVPAGTKKLVVDLYKTILTAN